MLWTALRRLRDEEDGFTLIELMVVVMILAILIVMGLPTFLGVKARFQDRAAQTDLRNVVLAARIMFTDNATFTPATSGRVGTRNHRAQHVLRGRNGGDEVCRHRNGCLRQRRRERVHQRQLDARRSSSPPVCPSSQSCFVILDATTGTRYGKTTAANCYADWATPVTVTATTPAAAGW